MYRAVATFLLLAQLGVLAAPVLVEAGPPVRFEMARCAAHMTHAGHTAYAGPVITQTSEKCADCDMPECPGMTGCAGVSAAIVSLASVDLAPAAEVVADQVPSGHLANRLSTPLPPPPRS